MDRRKFNKLVGATVIGTGVVLPFQTAAYAPVKITYRTDGPWGLGKGVFPLTFTEVDSNFYALAQRLEELEKKYADLLSR